MRRSCHCLFLFLLSNFQSPQSDIKQSHLKTSKTPLRKKKLFIEFFYMYFISIKNQTAYHLRHKMQLPISISCWRFKYCIRYEGTNSYLKVWWWFTLNYETTECFQIWKNSHRNISKPTYVWGLAPENEYDFGLSIFHGNQKRGNNICECHLFSINFKRLHNMIEQCMEWGLLLCTGTFELQYF